MGIIYAEDDHTELPSMQERLLMAHQLLHTLKVNNTLNENDILLLQGIMEEQCTIIKILKEENFQMQEQVPHMQPLHEEFVQYQKVASDSILSLDLQLIDVNLKVVKLEKRLTQLGMEAVLAQSAQARAVDEANQLWHQKMQNTHSNTKEIIKEVVKKHCEVKKAYETVIHGLKEQIAHKEAEVAWCQLMIKERDINIDKEMGSLKKELEVTTVKNQELLQQRLTEVEKRANKMTRKCLRLQQDYELKISSLKKEKDLQVQMLQKFVGLQNIAEKESGFKDTKLADAVKELEVRYRKIIVSLHSAAQHQRMRDMKTIATLESAVIPVGALKTE